MTTIDESVPRKENVKIVSLESGPKQGQLPNLTHDGHISGY